MNFFKRYFSKNKTLIQCPRCLGKGHVDQDDIKRLRQELKWRPGKCAYCNGKGEVESDMISKVAVDEAYLSTDLSQTEREQLINRDFRALERMREFNAETDQIIEEIKELHFVRKLDVEQITRLYLQSTP